MAHFQRPLTILLFLAIILALPGGWLQAALPPPSPGDQEYHRQRELERQRREKRQDEAPDIHFMPKTIPEEALTYPDAESPCFVIREIILTGEEADQFQWALAGAEKAKGRCLGSQGFNVLIARMQNLIVEKGFVTTRLAAGPQNLASGRLVLAVIPGRVRQVRLAEDSGRHVILAANMPVKPGDILNVRDMEQGLENLKRSPNAQADIRIVPGEQIGESDLVVSRNLDMPLRFSLGVDDTGSMHTGKMQATATMSIDNPTGLSDMFSFSYGHNLEGNREYGTRANSFYYSVPWGYNLLTFSTGYHTYRQTVVGAFVNYEYSGENRSTSMELSRIVHRGAWSKTRVGLAAFLNSFSNYIDDVELEIQKRRMAGWEAFVQHHHNLGAMTLDGELRYHRGTGAFGALRAPEEEVGEGTSRPAILSLNVRGQYPFQAVGQNFRYSGQWRQQWAFDRLVFQDRFSIGGRYTVRGYDGNMILAADNGFSFRNELGWNIANSGQELYAAFDIGRVWGPMDEYLLGRTLGGGALGLRGAIKNIHYDLFVSTPLIRPERFPGNRLVAGFSLVWNF